jgi:hypothetical protein
MKKSLLVAVFLVLAVAFAWAGPFGAGLMVGTPLSWAFGGDWDDSLDQVDGSNFINPGISAGVFAWYDITPAITIQVEAHYGLYQWSLEGKLAGDDVTVDSRLDLLEFPILAMYKLSLWKGALKFFAGPDLWYGTGRLETTTAVGTNPEDKTSGELDSPWAFAATGGAGYELPLGPGILSLDVRYTRLFTPLAAKNIDPPQAEFDYFIHAVSIYASYGYRFGN